MRLAGARDFERVFRHGARSGDGGVTVIARRNGLPHPRLGLAVARKVLRRAVARNRVKRVVRESFRHNQTMLAGYDFVVLARPGIARSDARVLRAALERHWRRALERCRDGGRRRGERSD